MRFRTFLLRFLSLTSLAVWFGGFVFYGGAVVPVLREELDPLQAGEITRRVTDILNLVGLVATAVGFLSAWFERSLGSRRSRRTRLALLTTTALLLAFLMVLHQIMDKHLDEIGLRGFAPLHRVYLLASTAQWVANLGLFAVFVAADRGPSQSARVEFFFRKP